MIFVFFTLENESKIKDQDVLKAIKNYFFLNVNLTCPKYEIGTVKNITKI